MEKPVMADNKPIMLELENGTYYWCKCGKSNKQPFCDGSHKGTGIVPFAFKVEEKKKAAFCMCKQTSNPPYCDGTHAKL